MKKIIFLLLLNFVNPTNGMFRAPQRLRKLASASQQLFKRNFSLSTTDAYKLFKLKETKKYSTPDLNKLKKRLFVLYHPDTNTNFNSKENFQLLHEAFNKILEDQKFNSQAEVKINIEKLFKEYERDYETWKEEQEFLKFKEKEKETKAKEKKKNKDLLKKFAAGSAGAGIIGFLTYELYQTHVQKEIQLIVENGDIEKLDQLLNSKNLAFVWKITIDINQIEVAKFLLTKEYGIFEIFISDKNSSNKKNILEYALENNKYEIVKLICQAYKEKLIRKTKIPISSSLDSNSIENIWQETQQKENFNEFIENADTFNRQHKEYIIQHLNYINRPENLKLLRKAISKNDYEMILILITKIDIKTIMFNTTNLNVINFLLINGMDINSFSAKEVFIQAMKNKDFYLMNYIANNFILNFTSKDKEIPWQILIKNACILSEKELIQMLEILKAHIPVNLICKDDWDYYSSKNCVSCPKQDDKMSGQYCSDCNKEKYQNKEATKNKKILIDTLKKLKQDKQKTEV